MHINFAAKQKSTLLSGSLTEKRLRWKLKWEKWFAVSKLSVFVAFLIAGILDSVEKCKGTEMNAYRSAVFSKVLLGRKSGAWVKGELVKLRSEI